jgi:hypothetical protein
MTAENMMVFDATWEEVNPYPYPTFMESTLAQEFVWGIITLRLWIQSKKPFSQPI